MGRGGDSGGGGGGLLRCQLPHQHLGAVRSRVGGAGHFPVRVCVASFSGSGLELRRGRICQPEGQRKLHSSARRNGSTSTHAHELHELLPLTQDEPEERRDLNR
jgi:hypothetical protein